MRLLTAGLLLSALAGCGAKPVPAASETESTIPIAAAEEDRSPSTDAGVVTAIDAATGDARAMPADSTAPSPYDLALRAEQAKDRAAERDARTELAAPVPALPGAEATLPGADEAVTTGG